MVVPRTAPDAVVLCPCDGTSDASTGRVLMPLEQGPVEAGSACSLTIPCCTRIYLLSTLSAYCGHPARCEISRGKNEIKRRPRMGLSTGLRTWRDGPDQLLDVGPARALILKGAYATLLDVGGGYGWVHSLAVWRRPRSSKQLRANGNPKKKKKKKKAFQGRQKDWEKTAQRPGL
jgi:hypothetical protein